MKHEASSVLKVGCILLVVLFLFYALSLLPQSVQAQTVTATIPVGTAPNDVAVTPNGAYAYVANEEGNTVSVINTATNTVTATITGFNDPLGVAVTPNGAYAYVTNDVNDGSVSVINTATNKVTATIPAGNYPTAVAVTPSGAYAYVANSNGYANDSVSVINTATNTLAAAISLTILRAWL